MIEILYYQQLFSLNLNYSSLFYRQIEFVGLASEGDGPERIDC